MWINKKKEGRVLIKNDSKEYKQKRISLSTQKHKHGGYMEKSVLGITIKIINQKKVMTKTEVQNFAGSFVVKLRSLIV